MLPGTKVVDNGDNRSINASLQPVISDGEGRVVEFVLEKDVEVGRGETVPKRKVHVVDRSEGVRALRLGKYNDLVASGLKMLDKLTVVEVPAGHLIQIFVNDEADAHQ
jgi:hypothetical protein